jgi:hypothetical protein
MSIGSISSLLGAVASFPALMFVLAFMIHLESAGNDDWIPVHLRSRRLPCFDLRFGFHVLTSNQPVMMIGSISSPDAAGFPAFTFVLTFIDLSFMALLGE